MMTDYFIDQSYPLFVFAIISIIAFFTKESWTDYMTKKYGVDIEALGSVKTEEISFYEALTSK